MHRWEMKINEEYVDGRSQSRVVSENSVCFKQWSRWGNRGGKKGKLMGTHCGEIRASGQGKKTGRPQHVLAHEAEVLVGKGKTVKSSHPRGGSAGRRTATKAE